MRAVEQWAGIEAGLEGGWESVRLAFEVEDPAAIPDASSVLGPLGPGRTGNELRFAVSRRGGAPEQLRNLLGHLDRKRVWGTLALVDTSRTEARTAERPPARVALAERWDAEVAKLPPDWKDLLCELELDSSDFVARAALLGAPLNPTRHPDASVLRFRASSGGGYGTATVMVRRCLERMDAEGVTGEVRVLNALANTDNVATQGPVWRVAGRSV